MNQVETGGWADVEGFDAGTGDAQLSGHQVPDIVAFGKLLDDAFAYWFAKDRPATP